jgi:hypothetical protein
MRGRCDGQGMHSSLRDEKCAWNFTWKIKSQMMHLENISILS